jgi:hypothetical protein
MSIALGSSMLVYAASGMAVVLGSDLSVAKAFHSNVMTMMVTYIDDISGCFLPLPA